MRTNYLYILLLAFSGIQLHACTKETETEIKARAVVEAYLQPNQPAVVRITREILNGTGNTGNRLIGGLNVTIGYNGNNYQFTQNSFGEYENTLLPVQAGGQYELKFVYEGAAVSATTRVPEKPQNFTCSPASITIPTFGGGGPPSFPDPLKAKWNNASTAYHYIAIKSVDAAASEISNNGQGPVFNNTPDQGNARDINFRDFKYYGRNALILYRIQPELAALYNEGSSNSQNLSNVPTNITNGLGIFTAVNIADTVFVNVN
jgi:hypothetical protein